MLRPTRRIGSLPLGPLAVVGGYDLKPLSQAAGYPIDGILGIDFLSKHVVRIDLDRGLLLLLKSVPANSGNPIGIACDPTSGLPLVIGELGRGETTFFVIDTGDGRRYSGSLMSVGPKNQASRHGFQGAGTDDVLNLAGTSKRQLYRGEVIKLGEFSLHSPLFSGAEDHNSLGLGFWSRFVVTFDFPNRRVYLRKGAGYCRPERADVSVGVRPEQSGSG